MSESKKTIFCQIFRFVLHRSSSVARMSKRDKSEVFKGKANKGKIDNQWERERMRVRETKNPKRVGLPPLLAFSTRLQLCLSILSVSSNKLWKDCGIPHKGPVIKYKIKCQLEHKRE